MKTKYLFQALRFACLPTLSILLLLFFGFFDISDTIDFISSNNTWAITLRVILVIAEIALIYIMYEEYRLRGEKEEARNKAGLKDNEEGEAVGYSQQIYHLKQNWGSEHKYKMYSKSADFVLIERIPK